MNFINFFSKLFKKSPSFNKITAAKVLAIEKHPNADRLRVIKLFDGANEIYPIVCGAFNFGVGDMVALALPGANLINIHSEAHEPFILQKAKIRGVESQGMICAGFELGISKTPDEGILVLKNDVKPGSQFNEEMIE